MQEINAKYDKLFKILKDRHDSNTIDNDNRKDSNTKTDFNSMKYHFTEDKKLREALQQIINFEGINIEIIGCWIWVDGNIYAYMNELKELGFQWAIEKKKCHFHTDAFSNLFLL